MGFGRATRPRQSHYQQLFRENKQQLKAISKQGLENTSQREEPRPSQKERIDIAPQEYSAPPKLSAQEDKLLKRVINGDTELTEAEWNVIGKLQNRVNEAPTIKVQQNPQITADIKNVKKTIKKIDKKIERLSNKGMRSKIQNEIKMKSLQLKKLNKLLLKCPTC